MKEIFVPVLYDSKAVASTQYSTALQGIKAAAARYGQRLQLIAAEEMESIDFSVFPDVVILLSISMPFIERALNLMRIYRRTLVLTGIDSEQFGSDVSCATPSRRAETQQLVNYLYHCGKRRIALVGFEEDSINDNFRYHAAITAAAVWGDVLSEKDVWHWKQNPSESFGSFLDVYRQYDAVICPNDVIAILLINECKKRGIRIPQDLYLASFGNMSVSSFYSPTITTVTMDMFSVGEQTYNVWRFLTTSDTDTRTSIKITVPSRILARESTDCVEPRTDVGMRPQNLQTDYFYYNPAISVLVGLDNCLSQRDALDLRIIRSLMDGDKYETICEKHYISASTLRYRLNKVFSDAGVSSRKEFEQLIHRHLGNGNPFSYVN